MVAHIAARFKDDLLAFALSILSGSSGTHEPLMMTDWSFHLYT